MILPLSIRTSFFGVTVEQPQQGIDSLLIGLSGLQRLQPLGLEFL
jgi:hypothetical protein